MPDAPTSFGFSTDDLLEAARAKVVREHCPFVVEGACRICGRNLVACIEDASGEGLEHAKQDIRRRPEGRRAGDPPSCGI